MAPSRKTPETEQGIADLALLDRLLEHRTRLGACVVLSRAERASFSKLKQLLGETDGNLGAHLRKLEDAGYVSAHKEFVERKPVTWYVLTAPGKQVLATKVISGRFILGLKPRVPEGGLTVRLILTPKDSDGIRRTVIPSGKPTS